MPLGGELTQGKEDYRLGEVWRGKLLRRQCSPRIRMKGGNEWREGNEGVGSNPYCRERKAIVWRNPAYIIHLVTDPI